jgi:uncharacterized protein YacL
MIVSIAFTQFVVVSLGILAVNVLLKASGYNPSLADSYDPLTIAVSSWGLVLLATPLVWTAFANLCEHIARPPLDARTARATGVILAAALAALLLRAALPLL